MDIQNKKVLILGDWGLVGSATARKIMEGYPIPYGEIKGLKVNQVLRYRF